MTDNRLHRDSGRTAVLASRIDAVSRPKRVVVATRLSAAAGGASLLLFAYAMVAWFWSGDARPTRPRVPVPVSTQVYAWLWQIGGVVAFGACLAYLVRDCRRHRGVTTATLVFVAWTAALWLDPATNNYFRPSLLYNSYLLNLGSWAPHIPGWRSPNAHLLPEPILAYSGIYGGSGLLVSGFAGWVMRQAKRYRPRLRAPGLLLYAFAAVAVFDLLLELVLMRAGLWAYAGAVRSLSLWPGTRYQFPLYEPLLFGAVWTASGALRYFRDQRGRSPVERGTQSTLVRALAVTGFVHLTYAIYAVVFSTVAIWGGPYPNDLPGYLTNDMCVVGTHDDCPPR